MRTLLILLIPFFFGCSSSETTTVPEKTVLLNTDSLIDIERDTKNHIDLYKKVSQILDIDSLTSRDGESYRLILTDGGWGWDRDRGSPISITFQKYGDTTLVVFNELNKRKDSLIHKKVKFIPISHFDSISNMFDNYFWDHPITDYNCGRLVVDGGKSIFEAFKNGKHKIISERNCSDAKLLKNHYYNFFIYSSYSNAMTEKLNWYKNNPPK